MSVQLMAWAYRTRIGSPTEKAVLLALANAANGHTERCHPSIARLAEETEYNEKTVRRSLASLEAKGLIQRIRQTRADGTFGVYSYTFALDSASHPADSPTSGPADPVTPSPADPLPALEPEVNLEPEEDLEPDPPVVPPNGWTVDKRPVTDVERLLATSILTVWNEHAGTSLRSRDWLAKIVMRIREHPELTVAEHDQIIQLSLANPWWRGPPTPSVVYGSGAQFERQMLETGEAEKREERFEGMKELMRKARTG